MQLFRNLQSLLQLAFTLSDLRLVFRTTKLILIVYVICLPNLNTNGEVRVYTVLGKTNLTDAAWVCPTNAAHRFFKVKVEMP